MKKNIIITGASNGIGFETALELSKDENNFIVAIGRSLENLKRLHTIGKQLNPDCQILPVQFDIVSGDYEQGLIPFLAQKVGKINILINNAGTLINKPFLEHSAEDFYSMFESNVLGHVKMIQTIVPIMEKDAHILNIGSMSGFQGSEKFTGLSAYAASKSALHSLTECLAVELKEHSIHVNALALGSVQTDMLEQSMPGISAGIMAFEMGKYIADFALHSGKVMNGKVIPVALTTP